MNDKEKNNNDGEVVAKKRKRGRPRSKYPTIVCRIRTDGEVLRMFAEMTPEERGILVRRALLGH